jgi:hypothetical protein
MLTWNSVMRCGLIRISTLMAVAALFCNAQCYGNCLTLTCSTPAPPPACHHHEPSPPDQAPCTHQHSEFSSPEASIAKISLEPAAIQMPFVLKHLTASIQTPQFPTRSDTGSPPAAPAGSTISVIRI